MSSDPSHEFPDTLEQLCSSIDDGTKQNPFPKGPYPPIDNGGFAKSYAKVLKVTKPDDRIGEVMAFCTQDQIPVLYKLATEFAVCDNWFSSVPGPTMPNRLFAMGATACGMDRSNNWNDVTSWTVSGFSYLRGSFFDRLTANNKSYGLYFDSHFDPPGHSRAGSFPMAVFLKNIHAWNFAYMQSNAPGIAWPFSSHGDPFVTAVKKVDPKTNLPTYPHLFTWIEPNYGYQFNPGSGSSQHPRDTLAGGEELIATVYNALRASEIWENSVLIITWDEHGGYYDHVAPPEAAPPGDGTRFNDGPYSPGYKFDFSRMGVRVPAIVVSPLIPKNTIDHRQYDHTTILRTVEDLLGIAPLTARDEASSNLFGLFSLDKARSDCPVTVAAKSATTATRTATPADANDPVPQSGTIVSTVLIALKSQLEIDGSDTSKRDQAILQVDSIKTNSDAKAYLDSVYTMMQPPSEGK
jgi:phospholipase C